MVVKQIEKLYCFVLVEMVQFAMILEALFIIIYQKKKDDIAYIFLDHVLPR